MINKAAKILYFNTIQRSIISMLATTIGRALLIVLIHTHLFHITYLVNNSTIINLNTITVPICLCKISRKLIPEQQPNRRRAPEQQHINRQSALKT